MPAWLRWSLFGLLSSAAAAGCAHRANCCRPAAFSVSTAALETTLPEITPAGFDFDVSGVQSPEEVDQVLGRPFPPEANYRALSAEACQCMAAAASTQGNSMAAERRSLQAGASPRHGLSEEDRLRIRALRASELEARNKSASGALETYYSIAEAEANLSILAASVAEIGEATAKIKRLRGQGMQIPFDDSEFARQRIDLLDRQTDLELKVGQLNAQLVRLLGLETTDPAARIWPATDWRIVVEPIDMAAAVQEGLSLRPEMQFLASLPQSINTETLGVTRQVVAGASGLLGSQSKFTGLMELFGLRDLFGRGEAKQRELPVRRRQLADFTQQRRLEVTSEIQQAVRTVEARLREIAIAKEQAAAWERRIAELRGKQKIDEASFAEISSARLKAFQAQSDETHRIVGWKIAQAKLKEAQGKLVLECPSESFGCPPAALLPAAPLAVAPTAGGPTSSLISSRMIVASRPDWTPGDNHRR
ncbi:MAG TPA: hypothetical protein VN699_05090 [Pirellulales bacterium]|nr:hypothetical protein [Pirellulales bacterium]